LPELAAEAGISLRSAYKWLARYRSGGTTALVDRRSVRRTQRLSPATDITTLNPCTPSLHGEKPTTRYGALEGLEERKSISEIYGGNSAELVSPRNGL
jgi:hypothetical protein